MTAIAIENLTKQYEKLVAVDGLTLSINEGELFSLLGTNGAGKSTIIKMLSCLVSPTSGDAFLLNDSIVSNQKAVKQKINISPQESAVAGNLTVKENLEMIARIYGLDKTTAREKSLEISSRFGLSEEIDKKSKKLSGGMQRRLSLAMALITNPKILFLDEPTLGLDVLARRELWQSIRSLKGKVTIVLTTHYLDEVEVLSDRVGVISAGKLIAVGSVNELKEKTRTSNLEEAFVVLNGGTI